MTAIVVWLFVAAFTALLALLLVFGSLWRNEQVERDEMKARESKGVGPGAEVK